MDEKDVIYKSKKLSLILHHKVHEMGFTMDIAGGVPVSEILGRTGLTKEELDHVVKTNNKSRYAYSVDGLKIRASQGHSMHIELGYEPQVPPIILFHGTAEQNVYSILDEGIKKGRRHAVHLFSNENTAINVGSRHGKPVVLLVAARDMQKAGIQFPLSANGVWLTDYVDVQYIVV